MKAVAVVVAFLLSSTSVFADVCPKSGEVVQTTAYKHAKVCSVGTVVTEGRMNPDEYESCLGDVPAAEEHVLLLKNGKRSPMPSINQLAVHNKSLSANDRQLLVQKTWMVSDIDCGSGNTIKIVYWGGGNCDLCEQPVWYKVSPDGKVVDAHMR